jgi:replication factor C small subunit
MQLFTEKYRPKQMSDIILPSRIKDLLPQGKITQNLLLYGSAGLGKTTLARILASVHPHLYINVSDQSSVDVIREDITNFCSTISILDGSESLKVVILDEFDAASNQFYSALRGTIEKFADTARFVATCNFIEKIPEPIQSRFTCINFDSANKEEESFVKREFIKRVYAIFQEHKIVIEKDALVEFIKRNYPDMRSAMNKLQNFVIQGIGHITIDNIKQMHYSHTDLFKLCVSLLNPIENYKFLMSNYSNKVDDVLSTLGSDLPQYIEEHVSQHIDKIPNIIIRVAHYQSQRFLVIDPCISMLACVFEIQQIINK